MRTILYLLIISLFTINSTGQNLSYKELQAEIKPIGKFKSYTSKNNKVFNVGDKLYIGKPSNDTFYNYLAKWKLVTGGLEHDFISEKEFNKEIEIIEILAYRPSEGLFAEFFDTDEDDYVVHIKFGPTNENDRIVDKSDPGSRKFYKYKYDAYDYDFENAMQSGELMIEKYRNKTLLEKYYEMESRVELSLPDGISAKDLSFEIRNSKGEKKQIEKIKKVYMSFNFSYEGSLYKTHGIIKKMIPNKYFEHISGRVGYLIKFNGIDGYKTNIRSEKKPITPLEYSKRRYVNFFIEFYNFNQFEYIEINDNEYFKINNTLTYQNLYFNSKTFLLFRIEDLTKDGQIYQITNFKDYRFVDKISMPFYKEVISANVKAIYEFNEIVFNKQVKKIDFVDPKLYYSQ